MKRIIVAILLAASCAGAQTNPTIARFVKVDTNGVVKSPTNFWAANAGRIQITNAIPLSGGPVYGSLSVASNLVVGGTGNSASSALAGGAFAIGRGNDVNVNNEGGALGLGNIVRGNRNYAIGNLNSITNVGAENDVIAMGSRASPSHARTFVWASGLGLPYPGGYPSHGTDTFNIDASNGVYVGSVKVFNGDGSIGSNAVLVAYLTIAAFQSWATNAVTIEWAPITSNTATGVAGELREMEMNGTNYMVFRSMRTNKWARWPIQYDWTTNL